MEEGAYAGARFEETSSSDLSVAADGQVSTREKLGVGDYLLTVTVRGRPDSRAVGGRVHRGGDDHGVAACRAWERGDYGGRCCRRVGAACDAGRGCGLFPGGAIRYRFRRITR